MQLKTRDQTARFEGVTQLGIRHPIADKPDLQAPRPGPPKRTSLLEGSAASSHSSRNGGSGAFGVGGGAGATEIGQERANNAQKGAREQSVVAEVIHGKRKRKAASKAEAGRVDGFWGGGKGRKRAKDGESEGAASGGGHGGGRGGGQKMKTITGRLDGGSEEESDASDDDIDDLLDDLDGTDEDEGEARSSQTLAEPRGQERTGRGRRGGLRQGRDCGVRPRAAQSPEESEASGEDVNDLLEGMEDTDGDESDAERSPKTRAELHAQERTEGGREGEMGRDRGSGVRNRVPQNQEECEDDAMNGLDKMGVGQSHTAGSPYVRPASHTRDLEVQGSDGEEGEEKPENEDTSGSAESEDEFMEAKAQEFDDLLSYFTGVGLPAASRPEKPPPSMTRPGNVSSGSTKTWSKSRGGHTKDTCSGETKREDESGDDRRGAEDKSFLEGASNRNDQQKPITEQNGSLPLDRRGEMGQRADNMMPDSSNGATAADQNSRADGEGLLPPGASPLKSTQEVESIKGVDVLDRHDSRLAKADEVGGREDGMDAEGDSDLERDLEAMIDEEDGGDSSVGSEEDNDSSSEEEFAAVGMIAKGIGEDDVAVKSACEGEEQEEEEGEEKFAAVSMMAEGSATNSVFVEGVDAREERERGGEEEEEDATSSGEDDSDGQQAAKDFEDFLADL